ncbi:MAG: hypothetical protein WA687_04140 [Solirubrobacterales bacterium]
MTRNLKTLALALVAVLALSALAVSVASAQQGKFTSDGPATITGEETAGSPLLANSITGSLGSVTCDGSKFTGHAVLTHAQTTEGKKHEFLVSGATTATITPHFTTHCTAHLPILGTRPATVTVNGCDLVFHLGQTTGGASTFGLTVDVVCPPNKKMEVHIYKTGSVTHPDADAICTIKIGEENNQGIAGVHQTSTSNPADDLHIIGPALDIHTETSGTLCGTSTSETADLDVDVTGKGHNGGGALTGVTNTD